MNNYIFYKSLFDFFISIFFIAIIFPIILVFLIIIYLRDFSNPLYISNRVGIKNKEFKMIKLRSMIVNADKNGVDSTSSNDDRIT